MLWFLINIFLKIRLQQTFVSEMFVSFGAKIRWQWKEFVIIFQTFASNLLNFKFNLNSRLYSRLQRPEIESFVYLKLRKRHNMLYELTNLLSSSTFRRKLWLSKTFSISIEIGSSTILNNSHCCTGLKKGLPLLFVLNQFFWSMHHSLNARARNLRCEKFQVESTCQICWSKFEDFLE